MVDFKFWAEDDQFSRPVSGLQAMAYVAIKGYADAHHGILPKVSLDIVEKVAPYAPDHVEFVKTLKKDPLLHCDFHWHCIRGVIKARECVQERAVVAYHPPVLI